MRRAGTDQAWICALSDSIREHGKLFFRLANDLLRDPIGAEDVCQQAFMKAWQERTRIQSCSSLRAWLARVVVNESLQLRRRRRIEQRGVEGRALLSDCQAGPPQSADLKEAVVAAMEKLPELTRVVVSLRVMEGMSGNDVKDLLGCSASEVSRQLHAGMERLRELLGDWHPDVVPAPMRQAGGESAAER